jgi:hypothetical protein
MSADPVALAQEVSPRQRGLFLKNLADFQTELARIQAGFGPGFSVWAQRKELPMLVFRTLRRVQDLRLRGRELGVSFAEMHLSEGVAARDLRRALCAANSTADLLQAAMIVVPGVLAEAIDAYLKRNDRIYDLPSVPLLEASREELRTQAAWAKSALEVLAREAGETPDATFVARVQTIAESLPEALETHFDRTPVRVQAGRRMGRLPLAEAVLPAGFRPLPFGPESLSRENEYRDRERYHAVNFLQEVQAADSCASMLFEAPDMPWDFYFDLSRHLWDESRHAMFGERKLADLGSSAAEAGLSSTAYTLRQTLTPLDRYAALATQEADAFPGKHAGLKDAVAHGDSVSAMAWSYDIADETQHVRFGNKWIPVMIEKTGEPRSLEQVKEDAVRWRATVLAEAYKPAAATFARPDEVQNSKPQPG